jgi:outer membrane protein assembly factor BamB
VYFANDNGDVYKIRDDGLTKNSMWDPPRALGTQVRSSINVYGDRLYFGAADNKMHCIDKTSADGADCGDWPNYDVSGTVSGTPLVDDRTGVNRAWIGTKEGGLVQLKTADGLPANSHGAGAIVTSPFGDIAWSDSTNRIFFTSTDGNLYVMSYDLTVEEHVVGNISPIYTSPYVWTFGGTRYVFFGDEDGRMHKVSTRTWTDDEDNGWPFQAGGAIRSGPVPIPAGFSGLGAGEDYLYFGCDDGYIYAVNINTGQLRTGWPVATGGPVRADPTADLDSDISKYNLVVGSTDGRIYTIYIGP